MKSNNILRVGIRKWGEICPISPNLTTARRLRELSTRIETPVGIGHELD